MCPPKLSPAQVTLPAAQASEACHPPSPLAFQTDACLAHCYPADHKRGFTLPRGAGNFRWIILGPGKPVFNRTYCLNLAMLNHVSLCVDWACMSDSPGQMIVRYVQYFHLLLSAHLLTSGENKKFKKSCTSHTIFLNKHLQLVKPVGPSSEFMGTVNLFIVFRGDLWPEHIVSAVIILYCLHKRPPLEVL